MKLLKDILTGIDGQTYDNVRVYMLFGIITYLVCAAWHLYDENVFEFQNFAIGFAAILAGGGAGIGFKSGTEPK
jgi:hypothetical protein